MGDAGDYWRDAKRSRKAAERRIGTYICACGGRVWMTDPKCPRCDTVNADCPGPGRVAVQAGEDGNGTRGPPRPHPGGGWKPRT